MSDLISRRSLIASAAGALVASRAVGQQRVASRPASSSFDPDRFVDDVRQARVDGGQAAVEEILGRAVSQPGVVMAGIGTPTLAGIHTLYSGDDLTVLNVIWSPLMVLLPHNHKMWASIGVYTGREDNIVWERRGDVIEATRASALSEKEVFGLPEDAIHSVTNPIGRLTGAIHVYGGNFFAPGRSEWDAETLRERPFDLEAARDQFRKASERFNAVPL
jgi:predicted metal-dependent enzyme (double-stranded beta helix superfamily)